MILTIYEKEITGLQGTVVPLRGRAGDCCPFKRESRGLVFL
jgi:hypothetical protein